MSVLGVLVLDRAVSVLVLGVSVSGAPTVGVLVLDRTMRPSVRASDALAWCERCFGVARAMLWRGANAGAGLVGIF